MPSNKKSGLLGLSRLLQRFVVRSLINLKQMLTNAAVTQTQTGLFAKNKTLEVSIMKLASIIVAAALAIRAASSFAQSQRVTRAQVKAELVQLRGAGYNPGMDRVNIRLRSKQQRRRSRRRTGKRATAVWLTRRPHRAVRLIPAIASLRSISVTNRPIEPRGSR